MEPSKATTSETAPKGEELRALVSKASEVIAHYWPMRGFVHHNPLHNLASLNPLRFRHVFDSARIDFWGFEMDSHDLPTISTSTTLDFPCKTQCFQKFRF